MESDKNKASYTVVYKLHRQMKMQLVSMHRGRNIWQKYWNCLQKKYKNTGPITSLIISKKVGTFFNASKQIQSSP